MSQGALESVEATFADLRYDRVCRTSYSEAYLLSEGESPFGRVDLHFGTSVVHAVLIVEREQRTAAIGASPDQDGHVNPPLRV